MKQVQAAERGVALAVAAVRAYDSASFTLEEEETLEQQCKSAMATFRKALGAAEDWLDEQANAIEPALVTAHRSQLTQHHARLQEYTMTIRKVAPPLRSAVGLLGEALTPLFCADRVLSRIASEPRGSVCSRRAPAS